MTKPIECNLPFERVPQAADDDGRLLPDTEGKVLYKRLPDGRLKPVFRLVPIEED